MSLVFKILKIHIDMEMLTCFTILAWKLSWRKEPGGPQSKKVTTRGNMLMSLTVVIISLCICIPKHHLIHPKSVCVCMCEI